METEEAKQIAANADAAAKKFINRPAGWTKQHKWTAIAIAIAVVLFTVFALGHCGK